jgi:hypothetical protein
MKEPTIILSYENDQYKILMSNSKADSLVNMNKESDNQTLILERPIFRLVTNESIEEMGLQGSDQDADENKYYKSLLQLLDDKSNPI